MNMAVNIAAVKMGEDSTEASTETITEQMAQDLLANDEYSELAHNLHRASGLSSEVAHKLIVAGYQFAVANNLTAFVAFNEEDQENLF